MTEQAWKNQVKVNLSLEEMGAEDATCWKVKGCYVHMVNGKIRTLASGEAYASRDDAKTEMEKRVLRMLGEYGYTVKADDLKWRING